jgi:3-phenylpropionate/trans-cinnamate dioxygenase ferredoxin subunit
MTEPPASSIVTGQPIRTRARRFVIGAVSDFPPGTQRIIEVNGRSVGIFNVDGSFHAILNRCPHSGAELCKGRVVGLLESDGPGHFKLDKNRKFLRCPWHGWEFELTTGQSYFDPRGVRVRHYSVDVEDGAQVTVELDRGEVRDSRLMKGPYQAEVYPIEVKDDYVVLSLR